MARTSKKKAAAPLAAASQPLVNALVVSNLVSLGLLAIRFSASGSYRYWFMVWNLFLAYLPLMFAWLFTRNLQYKRLLHWSNFLLIALWLGFLPNSFYILTDFIHLRTTYEVSLLYDVVLFASFTFNAYVMGFMALYMVHLQLLKRWRPRRAHAAVLVVILACSFAIYLGRYQRWNTWDVVINPAGLLFDVSDRIINPSASPRTLATTTTFFVLLSSMYYVLWQLIDYLRQPAAKAAKRPKP